MNRPQETALPPRKDGSRRILWPDPTQRHVGIASAGPSADPNPISLATFASIPPLGNTIESLGGRNDRRILSC